MTEKTCNVGDVAAWRFGELDIALKPLAVGMELGPLAERLYALGWRKGMTAEDAARLLVGKGA